MRTHVFILPVSDAHTCRFLLKSETGVLEIRLISSIRTPVEIEKDFGIIEYNRDLSV